MFTQSIRVLVSMVALFTLANSAALAETQSKEQGEIARLEKDFNDAYAANDLEKYFGFYADDMGAIFYNERSTLADYRKSWTDNIRSGKLVVVSVKLSDMVVRISPAADSAIASYRIDVRYRHANGKTTDDRAFETDVWFKRQDVWKVVHAQYSLAVAPPD